MITIELTKSQVNDLVKILDMCFIDIVRTAHSKDASDLNYLAEMCDVFVRLKDAADNSWNAEGEAP